MKGDPEEGVHKFLVVHCRQVQNRDKIEVLSLMKRMFLILIFFDEGDDLM